MLSRIKKIYFIHEGKEAYPEIAAYRSFFADHFETQEVRPSEVCALCDLSSSICWYIMGFHKARPNAGLVIHDYRSLSIGRFWFIKDQIKRLLNAKPDIRIFQNAEMQKALCLNDNVPTLFLPMGVPEFILDYRPEKKPAPDHDFCYIGVMSKERCTTLMIDSFLRRFGGTKSFLLFGLPEEEIVQKYHAHKNVIFMGRKPQQEVFTSLARTRVAVNYFPNHNPHKLQTPTKLLEYAALGLRILCNEQPQSRSVAARYGLSCHWGSATDMFAAVPEELYWPDNSSFDPRPLLWPEVIATSGIKEAIDRLVSA